MENENILQAVTELFSTMTESEQILPESELIEDLEVSSMDVLYLISCLEEQFGVKVPEKAIRKMYTVADVVGIIAQLLQNAG